MNSAGTPGHRTPRNLPRWIAVAALTVLLAACGGGGGGASSDGAATPGTVVETAPATVTDLAAAASGDTITLSFKVSDPQNVTAFEAVCTGNGPSVTTRSASHGTATDTVSVSGLADASSYSCTVAAINSSGTSTPTSPVQATTAPDTPATPSKPVSVTVTSGPQSAVVTFTESSANGGAAVSGYVATCTDAASGQSVSSYGVASPIVVVGLTEGVAYTCTVSAINAQGTGDPSDTSDASKVVPAAPAQPTAESPARPTGVVATAGAGSATVAFNAVEADALYRATCASSDGKRTVSAGSSTSPITVPNLTNGSSYACSVTVTTAAGTSLASDAATVTPATVPDAPTLTKVTAGDRIATLEFTAPQGNGGLAINGYHAVCSAGAKTGTGDTGDVNAAGSVVVAGLDNDSTYSCRVAATNKAGTGAYSSSVDVTPIASTAPVTGSVAGTPAIEQASSGNGSATFVATATTSTSPVLDYTATCTATPPTTPPSPPISATSPASPTSAATSVTVTGLVNGTTYSCVVTARTEAGPSTSSAPQIVTPAVVAPKPPTLVNLTPGNATIAVAFTPGDDSGAAVSVFTATCGDRTGSGATTPVTVSGLTNGKTYSCSVTATNRAGTSEKSDSATAQPRTVPQKPSSVTATAGTSTITVGYALPDNGGANIIDFEASCQSGSIYTAKSLKNTDTSITVSVRAVPDGSTYDCTVIARNTAGPSDPSDTVRATPTAAAVEVAPDAATNLQMTVGDSMLTVSFDTPISNGADVSYSVICSSDDITKPYSGDKPAVNGSATMTGLVNGTSYSCLVRAKRGSKVTDAYLPSATPNAMPTAPTLGAVVAADRQLTIPYSKPAANGSDVTYGASCGAGSVASTGSAFVVTGLVNGQAYSCSVTASNSKGEASASTSGTPFTNPDAPGLSVAAGTASAGNASLNIAITAPANNGGSAISGYELSCSAAGGAPIKPTLSGLTATVTGLPTSTAYTCTAKALSQAGGVSAEVSATATTAATSGTAPGAPGLVVKNNSKSSAGNAILDIALTAPSTSGSSAISSYEVGCTVAGIAYPATVSNMSAKLTGLPNGSAYTCNAVAKNGDNLTSPAAAASGTTAVTAPGAPGISVTNDPASSVGNAILNIVLTAPASDGGSPIINYSMVCTIAGIPKFLTHVSMSTQITGLKNGKSYTCGVTATNAANLQEGASASGTTAVVSPVARTLTLTAVGDKSLSYAFSTVSGESYTASCTIANTSTAAGTATVSGGTVSVTGLTNGTIYGCKVTSTNSGGGSASSDSVNGTPNVIPTARTLTLASVGNGTLTYTFSVVPGETYTASCTLADLKTVAAGSVLTTADGIVSVTGLTNGTEYACTVKSTNSAGSVSSASVNGTPSKAPDAPKISVTNNAASSAGNAILDIALTAPSSNGGTAISSYEVACNVAGTAYPATVSNMSAKITGLPNGSAYACTAKAKNGGGFTSVEATASGTTAVTAPAAPTAFGAADCTKISFTFIATNTGGSPIIEYALTFKRYTFMTSTEPELTTTATTDGNVNTYVIAGGQSKYFTIDVIAKNAQGPSTATTSDRVYGKFCSVPVVPS